MSVTVVPAKVKYVDDTNPKWNLNERPCGVVVTADNARSNKPLDEKGETFFGISMAPTMSKSEVNISLAVAGICTALIANDDDGSPHKARHLGTQLYFNNFGKLTFKDNKLPPVATYLQKNGIDTALVWLSGLQVMQNGKIVPDQADGRGFGGAEKVASPQRADGQAGKKKRDTTSQLDGRTASSGSSSAGKPKKKKREKRPVDVPTHSVAGMHNSL